MTGPDLYHPESGAVLWEGAPSDAASLATGGRVQTAGYRLTADALHFATGVMSNREEQVPLWAIRDADLVQTITQKARGVGDLRLILDPQWQSSFGQQAVVLKSIREPRNIRDLLLRQANAVRRYWAEIQHQRSVEASRASASNINIPAAPAPSTSTSTSATPGDEMMARLTQLGEMKTAGLLTDQEFAAAKAKLLGL